MSLLRLGYKKTVTSVFGSLLLILCPSGHQVTCYEGTLKAYGKIHIVRNQGLTATTRVSLETNLRPPANSHVPEPFWKKVI